MYLINIIPTQKEKEAQKEKTTDEYHQETKLLKKKTSKNTQPNHRPTISCHLYQKHEITIKTPTQTL